MSQIPNDVPSTVETLRRRGGTWTRSWHPDREARVEELLDLAFETFSQSTWLPVAEPTRRFFRRRYRRAALRLVDDRVWRLVGEQLLSWLAHEAQLAEESARNRGAHEIGIIDFRQAVRDVHRISASALCDKDPEDPDGPGLLLG